MFENWAYNEEDYGRVLDIDEKTKLSSIKRI